MTGLTLTKAGRLQERLRAAVRDLPLTTHVTIGIFAAEPAATIEREAAKLRADLDVLTRLLSILAKVRAAAGRANAEHGIGDLLAEKAAIDEEINLLVKLIPTQGSRADAEDFIGALGTTPRPGLRQHAGEIETQVDAMRARYQKTERGETTVEVPLLDEAEAKRLRERIVARRRRLEEIGDRLRELNSSIRIDVDDEALAYLRDREVI